MSNEVKILGVVIGTCTDHEDTDTMEARFTGFRAAEWIRLPKEVDTLEVRFSEGKATFTVDVDTAMWAMDEIEDEEVERLAGIKIEMDLLPLIAQR